MATFTTTSTLAASTGTSTSVVVQSIPGGLNEGLNYYYYVNTYNYSKDDPGFHAATFNSPSYLTSGFLTDVNSAETVDYPDSGTACAHDPSFECTYATYVMQGYLYAANGTGDYTIATPKTVDNALYFWSGTKAFDSYTNDNVDYQAVRAGRSVNFYGGSFTIYMAAGELVPVTIMWVNGGGVGKARMTIESPDGTIYASTAGFFAPAHATECITDFVDPFSP